MLGFLILFPLVVAGVLLVVRNNRARNVIVGASALVIGLASVWLVVSYLGAPWITYDFYSPVVDYVCMAVSVLIAAAILYFGIKYKNLWACVLAAVQVVGSLVFEFGFAHDVLVTEGLYLDSLSLLMAFIIGVIGSGICVYALGYMEDFQAHEPEGAKDRRPTFFALMFVFLAAMFLIVFSNNMLWLFTGWEITTVCSFLLIGFTRTEEAIKNAFRQIIMNLSGGLAFLFQEILQCQAIHHGAKHAHVVAAGAVDAGLLQFRPTEEVTAADHNRYLHALLDSGNDFTCDASDHGRIDADLATTECLAGELE